MRKQISVILLVAPLILTSACRTAPPVEPAGDNAAAMVTMMGRNAGGGIGSQTATAVMIAKLENGKISSKTFESTFFTKVSAMTDNTGDKINYWLNPEPGEYVFVGYRLDKIFFFLDEKSALRTVFKVEPAKLTVIGIVQCNSSGSFTVDEFQKQMQEKFAPGEKFISSSADMLRVGLFGGAVRLELASVNSSAATLSDLRAKAKRDFAETKWSKLAE